jgi:ribosome-binding protein aMBF1 (putative translation factor)
MELLKFKNKVIMPTEMEKFAKFVKDKRTALGLSIPDLSEKITGSRRDGYIQDIESGFRKGITLEKMEQILKALNTEIKYNEFCV